MIETVYKVVLSCLRRGFASAFVHGIEGLSLTYAVDEWTKPSIGLIYAFKTLRDAQRFRRDGPGGVVFEAEAEVADVEPAMLFPSLASLSYTEAHVFWKRSPTLDEVARGCFWAGIVMCKRLKLVKEVA